MGKGLSHSAFADGDDVGEGLSRLARPVAVRAEDYRDRRVRWHNEKEI